MKGKRPKLAAKGTASNPIQLDSPKFKTEAEEAAWWDANSETVTDLLIKYGRPSIETKSITVRLPVQDIERARSIAEKRGVGYQTLIKALLHDALKQHEEKAS